MSDKKLYTLCKITAPDGEVVARLQSFQAQPYIWRDEAYNFAGFEFPGVNKSSEIANYRVQLAIAADPLNVSTLISVRSWLRDSDLLRRHFFEFFTFDPGSPNAIIGSSELQGATLDDDESSARITINLKHPLDAIKRTFPTASIDSYFVRFFPIQTSTSF